MGLNHRPTVYETVFSISPMHIMPVTLWIGAVGAAFQGAREHRGQMHRLIQQAVKQQPARTRRAPIEPKGKFVEVVTG